MRSVAFNGIKYEWLGQSTVRMTADDGFAVYTDPVFLDDDPPKAGLILITHHHVDHCLPEYVAPIRDEQTKLAAFHESYVKYCAKDIKGVRTVKAGQTIELGGVVITGVEAYTKRGFHIKGEGCGFLIELRGQRIYFSGDTSNIKEMEGLGAVDVAILPIIDNTYTIGIKDTAEALKVIRPRLFIPVHYTPMDERDPELTGELLYSKDPRFYTSKEDPSRIVKLLDGTDINVAVLSKIGKTIKQ